VNDLLSAKAICLLDYKNLLAAAYSFCPSVSFQVDLLFAFLDYLLEISAISSYLEAITSFYLSFYPFCSIIYDFEVLGIS